MRTLISHPAEEQVPQKLLVEHLENVGCRCAKYIEINELKLSLITKSKLKRLGLIIGLMHDFGKSTSYFQKYIRLNRKNQKTFTFQNFKSHSLISAIVAFYVVKKQLKDDLWAYLAFQIINRHHGELVDFDLSDYKINKGILKDQLNNIINYKSLSEFYKRFDIDISIINNLNFNNFIEFLEDTDFFIEDNLKNNQHKIEYFLITNYLFSLLIESDKNDAARLENENYFENNLKEKLFDISEYIDYCRRTDPQKFDSSKPVNKLRNKFLQEIQTNPNINKQNHFYTLTAPTGIGKTFGCLAFAEKLKEKLKDKSCRIIYCLPYTSIIDQNYREFQKIIHHYLKQKYEEKPHRFLLKHHYLTSKTLKNRNDKNHNNNENRSYKDYLEDKLLVESWQPALIVTTFVQLFHSIFSNKNRNLKKFHNIINSIIILDEVQNIDPDYYLMIREVFTIFARRFNTYFLLMTATQPEILSDEIAIDLVNPEPFMRNSIFNRVKMETNLKITNSDKFLKNFTTNFKERNALLVVNTKKMAVQLFKSIEKKFNDFECYCLTNYLIPKDKERKIKKIRAKLDTNKKIIVISTQLIEAGVDLSFKRVYRDLAPLDSIIQVAGRCNRSNEYGNNNGRMTLVNLDNHGIYNSQLIQFVEELLDKEMIESKDFYEISQDFYQRFNFAMKSKQILRSIYHLNYTTEKDDEIPVENFSLIDENNHNNIFIFPTKKDQAIMDEFLTLKRKLENFQYENNKEKEKILMQIENKKIQLKKYQLSLYPNDLKTYLNFIQPADKVNEDPYYPYKYISAEHISYDKNIGFRPKSEEEQIDEMFI